LKTNSGDPFKKPDDEDKIYLAQVEAEIDLYKKFAVVRGKMSDKLETSPLAFWKKNAIVPKYCTIVVSSLPGPNVKWRFRAPVQRGWTNSQR
jgi:hypothetical protein